MGVGARQNVEASAIHVVCWRCRLDTRKRIPADYGARVPRGQPRRGHSGRFSKPIRFPSARDNRDAGYRLARQGDVKKAVGRPSGK